MRTNLATFPRSELSLRDLNLAVDGLQDVYFVSLFSHFESALRDYWRSLGKTTKPPVKHLIVYMGGKRRLPQDWVDSVQDIRN